MLVLHDLKKAFFPLVCDISGGGEGKLYGRRHAAGIGDEVEQHELGWSGGERSLPVPTVEKNCIEKSFPPSLSLARGRSGAEEAEWGRQRRKKWSLFRLFSRRLPVLRIFLSRGCGWMACLSRSPSILAAVARPIRVDDGHAILGRAARAKLGPHSFRQVLGETTNRSETGRRRQTNRRTQTSAEAEERSCWPLSP